MRRVLRGCYNCFDYGEAIHEAYFFVVFARDFDGAFDFKAVAAFAPLVDFFADFFANFFFFFGRLRPLRIHRRNAA